MAENEFLKLVPQLLCPAVSSASILSLHAFSRTFLKVKLLLTFIIEAEASKVNELYLLFLRRQSLKLALIKEVHLHGWVVDIEKRLCLHISIISEQILLEACRLICYVAVH